MALAQNENQAPEQRAEPVLAINSAGMNAWLTSEKDRGLRQLLEMIEPRLAEIPGELEQLGVVDDGEIPPGLLEALWGVATLPQALEVRLNLGRLGDGQLPADIQWAAIAEDLPGASNTIGTLRGLLADGPLEIRGGNEPGVFVAETPATPVYFGAKRSGGNPLLFFGTEAEALPDLKTQYAALPNGVTPLMSLRFDLAQLTPVIGMPVGMAPPVVGELLMEGGLIGWDATRFDLSVGQDERHTIAVARMTGAARAARLFTIDPERTLSRADLQVIPADATYASAGLYDPTKTLDLAKRILESLGIRDEVESALRDGTQVDVATVEAVVASLGDSWVTYQSDSTGGGDFASLVLAVSLRDSEAFEQAVVTAFGRANAIGEREGRGYFRIRSSELRGLSVYSMTSPGLPFPAEPSMAIHDGRAFFALSVPSLLAAVDQQQRGLASIATRADVIAMAGGSLDGIAGFAFVDTERYARRGYAMMNHLMAGLANGVRSPHSDREPYAAGVAMPSFSEFVAGIAPSVSVTRWDGEDLVVLWKGDRSMAVQFAAGLGRVNLSGLGAQFGSMMGMGAFSGLEGARVEARSEAVRLRAITGARLVGNAAVDYAFETERGLPASVNDLVDAGYLSPDDLRSPYGSMMDGTPDIVIRGDLAGTQPTFAGGTVLALDRSALEFTDETVVTYMDLSARWLTREQLLSALETDKNRGAKASFGLR
jgi:hypothetical protein